MQEKYVIVQKGFRILVTSMSGYIGQEMNKVYKERWWDEVLFVLQDQRDLPMQGSYGELVDSLDVANCLRILERKWNDVFRNVLPSIVLMIFMSFGFDDISLSGHLCGMIGGFISTYILMRMKLKRRIDIIN